MPLTQDTLFQGHHETLRVYSESLLVLTAPSNRQWYFLPLLTFTLVHSVRIAKLDFVCLRGTELTCSGLLFPWPFFKIIYGTVLVHAIVESMEGQHAHNQVTTSLEPIGLDTAFSTST
jgi:hypothetical protein